MYVVFMHAWVISPGIATYILEVAQHQLVFRASMSRVPLK